MMATLRRRFRDEPLLMTLCLGLWILPLSNAFGQVPLYLVSVGWSVQVLRRGEWRKPPLSAWFLLGFALLILSGFFYAVRPENIVDKLNRLLLFPLVCAVPAIVGKGPEAKGRLVTLMFSLVGGTMILGAYDMVRIPLEVRGGARLFDTGHMAPPQVYMVALLFIPGIWAARGKPRRWEYLAMLLVCLAGILLHNKRGVWLAAPAAFGVWVLWSREWKLLLGMAAMVLLAATIPSVRARVSDLRDVVQPTHGGRMVLWNVVTPPLLEAYPWGMGYNGPEHEDFRAVINEVNATRPRGDHVHLEDRLRHLHNNFLQIRLELGPHGLAWWCLWMAAALARAFRPRPGGGALHPLRVAAGCALLGLLLNGLVEYNFGNSKILMIYLVVLCLIDASGLKAGEAQTSLPSPQSTGPDAPAVPHASRKTAG